MRSWTGEENGTSRPFTGVALSRKTDYLLRPSSLLSQPHLQLCSDHHYMNCKKDLTSGFHLVPADTIQLVPLILQWKKKKLWTHSTYFKSAELPCSIHCSIKSQILEQILSNPVSDCMESWLSIPGKAGLASRKLLKYHILTVIFNRHSFSLYLHLCC